MVFLTAPCTDEGEQPDGAPWPEDNPARLAVYNKLVREVAAEHPATDSVVDLFGAACPGGQVHSTVHGVTIRAPTASTSPWREAVPGPDDHAGRSWRPGGRRWRRGTTSTTRPQPAGEAGSGFTFWGWWCSRCSHCSRSATAG